MKNEKKISEKKGKLVKTQEKEKINPRGRVFEGKVIKKFPKRVAIEFERMIYLRKYERYMKSRTKIHARLQENLEKDINMGDLIRVQECRPLSKLIHFVVIKKIKDEGEK